MHGTQDSLCVSVDLAVYIFPLDDCYGSSNLIAEGFVDIEFESSWGTVHFGDRGHFLFDGSAFSFVEIENVEDRLDTVFDFSLSLMVFATGVPNGNGYIFSYTGEEVAGGLAAYYDGTSLVFEIRFRDDVGVAGSVSADMEMNVWYKVGFTYSFDDFTARIFLNDQEVATGVIGSAVRAVATRGALRLGSYMEQGFVGSLGWLQVDDVAQLATIDEDLIRES